MQSVCELNLFLHNNNTCLNNQCCPLQSSLLGTCGPLILALSEPFHTAYHLNWTSVWWLCLNLGEVGKSPVLSWIAGKAQLRTKKKTVTCSAHMIQCVLPVLGTDMVGFSTGFWVIPLNSHLITCYYLCDGSYGALSGSCQMFWHMLTFIFLLLLIQQVVDINLVVIWHMGRLSVRVFWADPNEIPNILVILGIVILLVWA